jgi:hypothetical protein
VHDTVLLDSMGAYGVARALADGYRERLDIAEMAASIEEAAAAILLTEPARALAEPRRRAMLDFAARLREELAEFSGELYFNEPGTPPDDATRAPGAGV